MNAETRKILKQHDVKVEKWSIPTMDSGPGSVFRHEDSPAEAEGEVGEQSSIPTAEDIEQWHREAHEEGYQEGLRQAQQENAELQSRLQEIIHFFEHPLQSLNEEVEQQLSLLAVTLAQQLVRREIRIEPGEIIALIREAVQLLPASSRNIKIYLNPDDADMVRSTLQLDEIDDEQSWKLVEDPMITRGGCEIKSNKSVINATLENRLQALAASILGGERSEDSDEPDTD